MTLWAGRVGSALAPEDERALRAYLVAATKDPDPLSPSRLVATSGLLDALHAVDAPFADLNIAPATPSPLHSFYSGLQSSGYPPPSKTRTSWFRCPR